MSLAPDYKISHTDCLPLLLFSGQSQAPQAAPGRRSKDFGNVALYCTSLSFW